MVIRTGTRGKFVACSGFPRCRNTEPFEKLDELRASAAARGNDAAAPESATTEKATGSSGPAANSAAAKRKNSGKRSKTDELGEPPSGYAWTRTGRPVVERLPESGDLVCPECGGTMELKRGRFGPFFSCSGFPRCKFVSNLRGEAKKAAEELMPAPTRPKPIPTDITCDECGEIMLVRQGPRGRFLGCSGYPKCKATQELPAGFPVPTVSQES
jgi:ssDNA-binding Zn-finger/Zn-ribbon topoisomerase 1